MVPARFCIALVVALVVGADAALPAFAVGTFGLVNPDANSDWAETYTQNADGTFTGYGSWTDAGQAYTYTYYGASTVQDCNKNTDGTMSTVEAFWWVSSGDYTNTPGMMWMNCVYITWSGSDASRTSTGRFRSAEVPIGTPLGECPLLPPTVANIPFMEVYGEVTRLGERTYKCVADCEPQPWDCDAASTEDGGSSGGGTDAASAGFIALYVVVYNVSYQLIWVNPLWDACEAPFTRRRDDVLAKLREVVNATPFPPTPRRLASLPITADSLLIL